MENLLFSCRETRKLDQLLGARFQRPTAAQLAPKTTWSRWLSLPANDRATLFLQLSVACPSLWKDPMSLSHPRLFPLIPGALGAPAHSGLLRDRQRRPDRLSRSRRGHPSIP